MWRLADCNSAITKRVRDTARKGAGRMKGVVEEERELIAAEATVGDKRLRIDNGQMRETARTVMGTALMRRH